MSETQIPPSKNSAITIHGPNFQASSDLDFQTEVNKHNDELEAKLNKHGATMFAQEGFEQIPNIAAHAINDAHIKVIDTENSALIDSLTNLPNRAAFLNKLEELMALTSRNPHNGFIFGLADVNDFGLYNKNFGMGTGDEVLRQIANELMNTLHRQSDIKGRLGGDEFGFALPYQEPKDKKEEHAIPAERFRKNVNFLRPNGISVGVTIGLVDYHRHGTFGSLQQGASDALNFGKLLGKNVVILSTEDNNGNHIFKDITNNKTYRAVVLKDKSLVEDITDTKNTTQYEILKTQDNRKVLQKIVGKV